METKSRLSRLVIWICSKFNRTDIEFIIRELSHILKNRNPNIKPKDDIKEKHPAFLNEFTRSSIFLVLNSSLLIAGFMNIREIFHTHQGFRKQILY